MNLEIPSSINIVNPVPVDKKYGPYANVAAAKAAIPVALRYKGLTVGVITSGVIAEYWWQSALTDSDLVAKSGGSTVHTDGTTIGGDGSIGNPLYAIPSGINVSGVYTPTVASMSGVTSVTPSVAMYTQIGEIVAVHGSFAFVIDGSPGTNREIRLDLPIASAFILDTDVSGVITGSDNSGDYVSAGITGSSDALMHVKTAANGTVYYSYFYRIYPM